MRPLLISELCHAKKEKKLATLRYILLAAAVQRCIMLIKAVLTKVEFVQAIKEGFRNRWQEPLMCGELDPCSCCFQFFSPSMLPRWLTETSQSFFPPNGNFLLSQFDWARSTGSPFPVLPVFSLHERRPTVENLNWDYETRRPQWAVPDSAQMWMLLDRHCVFRLVACHRLRRKLGNMSANLLQHVSANTPAKRDVLGVITLS